MKYPETELVLDGLGRPYHLGLEPENIGQKIILVGDQDRVDLIADYFDSVEHTSRHREFVCKTGMYNGKRISAISTGIGTDNVDIVINELDALVNIDLETKTDKENFKQLELVRIGTCGILQENIPVHSYILSTHAFGLDNVAHFYNIEFTDEEKDICENLIKHITPPQNIRPYLSKASQGLFDKLDSDQTHNGITVTSSGFYGPQGRQLRLKTKTQGINEKLGSFDYKEQRVTNFEMESSSLFSLGKALGHECSTICLGIANRPNLEFSSGYKEEMKKLILYVLDRV